MSSETSSKRAQLGGQERVTLIGGPLTGQYERVYTNTNEVRIPDGWNYLSYFRSKDNPKTFIYVGAESNE